jgi:hypothetical protein
MASTRTAFALAGLGGNNAHGAGFLAAAQDFQRQRQPDASGPHGGLHAVSDDDGQGMPADRQAAERARRGILPELEFISCTSGAIHTTAAYLRGEDIGADLERRIAEVERVIGLPRGAWTDPWRAPMVALFTGVPQVFGPWMRAFSEHVWERATGFFNPRSPLFGAIPTTVDALCDLLLPARAFVPMLPDAFFEESSATFNDPAHGVGVAFNSFEPRTGIEHLYVNDAALRLIREHHNPRARYGGAHEGTVYQPITPEAVRAALWLFFYGFPAGRGEHVDGAYARSIILDELTFAERLYAVKPLNHRWLGRLPQNLLEIQDMQTELWMGASYREQARVINTFNHLQEADRLKAPSAQPDAVGATARRAAKQYHVVDLIPVEIAMQRGFFTYFVEDREVYREAHGQSLRLLLDLEGDRDASQVAGRTASA